MPSSLWGFQHGDIVEACATSTWEMAKVAGFTTKREIIVTTDKESFVVTDPRMIRHWQRPSTPDAIEEFLNR